MQKLLMITLLITSFFSNAENNWLNDSRDEFTVKFGGWSHHGDGLTKKMFKKYEDKDFEYNENHSGLGFEYSIPYKETNHFLSTGLWYMKDSYSKDSFHAGIGYKYRFNIDSPFLQSIDLNLVLTYYNRSIIRANYEPYKEVQLDSENQLISSKLYLGSQYNIVRDRFIRPTPYITFNIKDGFNIDAMLLYFSSSFWDVVNENEFVYREDVDNVFFIRAGFTF